MHTAAKSILLMSPQRLGEHLPGPFLSHLLLSSIHSNDVDLIKLLIRNPMTLFKLQRTTHHDLLNYLESNLDDIETNSEAIIESYYEKIQGDLIVFVSNRLPTKDLQTHELKILVHLLLLHVPEDSRPEFLGIINKERLFPSSRREPRLGTLGIHM